MSKILLVHVFKRFHGCTGRKKLGGRKEISPNFSDCARVVKKYFPEKLSKIVVDGGVPWIRGFPVFLKL